MRHAVWVWMLVACRYEFDECDHCSTVGAVRCVDGVEQRCFDDGERCVGWGRDLPCTSGACADDEINACALTTCPATPIAITPFAGTPVANACMATGTFAYQAAELEPSTTIIDGHAVSGCWLVDFGQTCTPYQIGANAEPLPSACGADCGTSCATCGDTTHDATVLVFVSPVLDPAWFTLRLTIGLDFGSTTGGSSSMTPRAEFRYMLVCRPACGSTGWNIGMGLFQVIN